jgi:hypothetical protein
MTTDNFQLALLSTNVEMAICSSESEGKESLRKAFEFLGSQNWQTLVAALNKKAPYSSEYKQAVDFVLSLRNKE